MSDSVFLRNLKAEGTIGLDRWHRAKPQPVVLTIRIAHDNRPAASTDNIDLALDYRSIRAALLKTTTASNHPSVAALLRALLAIFADAPILHLEAKLPAAARYAAAVRMVVDRAADGATRWETWFEGVRASCILGINHYEREERQDVVVNARMRTAVACEEPDFDVMVDPLVQVRSIPQCVYLFPYGCWW